MKFYFTGCLTALALTTVLMPTVAIAAEDEKFVIAFRMVKPTTMETREDEFRLLRSQQFVAERRLPIRY